MSKKQKILPPVKSLKPLEKKYQRELRKLGVAMAKSVRTDLLSYLKAQQEQYVIDGPIKAMDSVVLQALTDLSGDYDYLIPKLLKDSQDALANSRLADSIGTELNGILRRLKYQYTGLAVESFAQNTATMVVSKTETANKKRFDRVFAFTEGVNISEIVAQEGLADFIELSVSKNVNLITSLSEEYFKQIETIANNGVINGTRYSEIEKQITAKVGSANSKLAGRIKTIARNEVSTMNSQLTLRRSENIGIKKGVYMTAEDDMVRECHEELDGQEYVLSKGAWSKKCGKFIQPGITDINCRCTYRPVIKV